MTSTRSHSDRYISLEKWVRRLIAWVSLSRETAPRSSFNSGLAEASQVLSPAKDLFGPVDLPQTTAAHSIPVELSKLNQLDNLSRELLSNQTQQLNQNEVLHLMLQNLLNQLDKHQHTINELCDWSERLELSNFAVFKENAPIQPITPWCNNLENDWDTNSYSKVQAFAQSALDDVMKLTTIAETLHQMNRQQHRSLESQQRLLWLNKNALTTMRLRSLESLPLLLCKSQGIPYGLPLYAIEQVILAPDCFVGGRSVLLWQRGKEIVPVPVQALSALLTNADTTTLPIQSPSSTSSYVVLVRTETGLRGIQVDQILSEQELIIYPLGNAIVPPPYAYGCCVTHENQLALVLDIRILLRRPDPTEG
jgi:chemotaxis protein histidine kinase CheA